MRRADLSLSGIYVLFTAVFLTASLVLAVAWYYRSMSMTVLLAVYMAFVLLLVAAFLRRIWCMVDMTISRMDEMLDQAFTNPAAVLEYDEFKLSLLEMKLFRLLTVSSSSAMNIAQDRNRIQTLVADISHQTKTPIANILLYTQLLKEQEDLSEESLRLARQITSQSEKLGFLVNALVKISRLETGIITVVPRPSRVGELLFSCVDGIEEKARQRGISLHISCAQDLQALFDPKWTEEAIGNIMDNAVKYTSPGGSITVSALGYEMFIRIDIADTGIGIDQADLNLVFKRFYRSPSLNQDEGVGIGLYLTREILSLQGGYIKVQSEPQKGSVFSVFLPK